MSENGIIVIDAMPREIMLYRLADRQEKIRVTSYQITGSELLSNLYVLHSVLPKYRDSSVLSYRRNERYGTRFNYSYGSAVAYISSKNHLLNRPCDMLRDELSDLRAISQVYVLLVLKPRTGSINKLLKPLLLLPF